MEASYEHLATKADVETVRTQVESVRTEMARLRADLEKHIEKLRADLTWRIVLAMSILTPIFVAIVRVQAAA